MELNHRTGVGLNSMAAIMHHPSEPIVCHALLADPHPLSSICPRALGAVAPAGRFLPASERCPEGGDCG